MELTADDQQQQLRDALDRFETSLETPFVPGEMERWIAAVESTWQELRPLLTWLVAVRHPQQYADIRQEDPGVIRRVEQMRQEDAAFEAAATELGQHMPSLKSAISNIEPDEAKLKPVLERFVDDALSLVIRVRKQEQAVRTWLLEAFTRDRGTVD